MLEAQTNTGHVPPGLPEELPLEDLPEAWRLRLEALQFCVCALLERNQQLRMALLEEKQPERRRAV